MAEGTGSEEVVITWTVHNWATIFLMALAGYAILAVCAQIYYKAKAKKEAAQ